MKTVPLYSYQQTAAKHLAYDVFKNKLAKLELPLGYGRCCVALRAAQLLYPARVSIHCNVCLVEQYQRFKKKFPKCKVNFNSFSADYIIVV